MSDSLERVIDSLKRDRDTLERVWRFRRMRRESQKRMEPSRKRRMSPVWDILI